jgi:hypothetical protein
MPEQLPMQGWPVAVPISQPLLLDVWSNSQPDGSLVAALMAEQKSADHTGPCAIRPLRKRFSTSVALPQPHR